MTRIRMTKTHSGWHPMKGAPGFRNSKKLIIGLLLLTSLTIWAGPTFTGAPSPPELKLSLKSLPSPLTSPGKGTLLLTVEIPSGYHLSAGDAVSIKFAALPGFSFGHPVFPQGEKEGKDRVYRERQTIRIPVKVKKSLAGREKGTLTLAWQGCQDFGERICFLPQESELDFSIEVKAAKKPVTPGKIASVNPGRAERHPAKIKTSTGDERPGFGETSSQTRGQRSLVPSESKAPAKAATGGISFSERFNRAAKSNLPLALLLAFLFGVLSSLTPCVYPVIPVTVAYIGSKSEGRGRLHGFFLSLAFVFGLAAVYSALGTFSARAGEAFGSLTQTPWVGIPIAVLFFVLALSMFNLFELRAPSFITNKVESSKQKSASGGFAGAFVIGALTGLVASPCIGPLILAILVVVAATGSSLLGFLYLFVFALGMGVLFIVIGTFSGVVASLPKSGGWMDGVRVLFGALILGAAFYFAGLYMSRPLYLLTAGVALGFTAGFLLFGATKHFFGKTLRVIAVLLCVAVFLLAGALLPAAPVSTSNGAVESTWMTNLGKGEEAARAANRPMLLDFRADWCAACLELERKTWPAPEVKPILSDLIPVKMDMTKKNDENSALLKRFDVRGLPTVVLLSPGGKEIGRFTGYRAPADTAKWLKAEMKKMETKR